MHINETEEYLGLLREKRAIIQTRVSDVEEKIGIAREVLDSDGIPEISLSDDEDASSSDYPPSSDFMVMETSSADSGSDPDQISIEDSSMQLWHTAAVRNTKHNVVAMPLRGEGGLLVNGNEGLSQSG